MRLIQFLAFCFYIGRHLEIAAGLPTCTVIAPEFIHSARKYSISLAVSNTYTSSLFEVTINGASFNDTRTIELQPNGVQIVEFDLPALPRDEYVLRVNGENGIYTETSTLLKYGEYKPIFVIQTDKFLYRREETLHYRILCMDEKLRPNIPDGFIDIKIMTQDHRIIYHKRMTKLVHFVISGELYLSTFELFTTTPMQQYVARLTVSVNNEILAAVTIQIENTTGNTQNKERFFNTSCEQHENTPSAPTTSRSRNISSEAYFYVHLENGSTEKILKPNKVGNFKVNSSIPFENFVYTIIGRGNIVHSERIQLLEKVRSHTFQLKATNQMAPLSKLLVYFIDENNNLHYDETMFNVEGALENEIIITTPTPIIPNKKFEFNITTAPNSYVGLLAIEETNECKSCTNHGNDIRLRELLKHFGGNGVLRGEITGSMILTTANRCHNKRQYKKIWVDEEKELFEMKVGKWQKTWLFAEIANTTSNSFILPHNLPNEDTTWRVTAFALHPEVGLGFGKLEPPIRTKKSYNVSIDLPEFIYQHEIINIPIRIDNFLNEEIHIRVEFVQDDYDIELIPIFRNDIDSIQDIFIPSKAHAVLKYTIRSSRTGTKSLKFLLFSLAGDYRQTVQIIVKPKGVAHIENLVYAIDLQNATYFSKEITPKGLYNPDTMSEYPKLATYANLMEPILEFLSKETIDQTAEQATSVMAMACLSLHFLQSNDRYQKSYENHILRNMHKSYLNLLDYRIHRSGSFEYFLPSKSINGSSWLTAYVGMWLPCVKKYIDVDETIIENALDYLLGTQNADGSFHERGVISNILIGNNTITMTAHVLLALLENERYYTTYKPVLIKGLKYLVENIDKTESLFAKALSTYIFYKAAFEEVNEELVKLEKPAQIVEEYKFWAQGNELELNNIATTALVLLTAIGVSDNFEKGYGPALKWLIEKGDLYNFDNRGHYPSQATVLSLEILIRSMQRNDVTTKADVTVGYRGLFRMEHEQFELKEKVSENKIFKLNNYIGGLELSATGQGNALALISFSYHALKENNEPQFEILVERPNYGYLVSFVLKICIKYDGFKEYADLTILETNMPSGYSIQKADLQQIVDSEPFVKHATINTAGSAVKLFILGLQRDNRQCVSMELFRIHSIAKQVPVPILCYEYTDVANMAVTYYDIELSTCDLCDGNSDCIKNCYSNK